MANLRIANLSYLVCFCIFTTSCTSGPPRWPDKINDDLRCGMSTIEVETLFQELGLSLEAQRQSWHTHIVFGNTPFYTSYMVFNIPSQGLESYQIIWDHGFKSTATHGRVRVCSEVKKSEVNSQLKGEKRGFT